jgi:predicted TIM-barrel fold metal-dependent hydrolase
MNDSGRRKALQVLLGAAASGAAGCCWRGYPEPKEVSARIAVGSPVALLPSPVETARNFKGISAVDAHAHFFNASDVPVRGFIAESVGHDANELLQPFIRAFALIAEKFAQNAPTAFDELLTIRRLAATVGANEPTSRQLMVDRFFANARKEAAQRLAVALRGSELLSRLRRASVARGSIGAIGLGTRGDVTAEQILDAVTASEAATDSSRQLRGAETVASQKADAAGGFLAFLFYMLSLRFSNLNTYRSAYSHSSGHIRVERVVGALVDFDRWLKCPPYSAHDDQVALHAEMALHAPGFLLPLVAYNPWSDIVDDGAGLTRVKNAIRTKQFAGVKIYPPMGFFPAGNAATPIRTRKKRPNLVDLDRVLDRFFADPDVASTVVMAHTSHSNGRDGAHDELGGPDGWRNWLQKNAQSIRLATINFGHFGGACSAEWTNEFATLMREHPSRQLYGDLGYWNDLDCGPGVPNVAARLRDIVGAKLGDDAVIGDRILFGTDWHMLSLQPAWASYPDRLASAVEQAGGLALVQKVFSDNARKCFSI